MYDSIDFAQGRLLGTVISYDEHPVYIKDIHHDGIVEIIDVRTSKEKTASLYDKKFSKVPCQLGYCNYNGEAKYLSRIPQRRWKQGIDDNSLYYSTGNRLRNLKCAAFANTIEGIYPPFEEAVTRVRENIMASCAFSRYFAVELQGKVVVLCFKGEEVGVLDVAGIPVLHDRFFFLKEMLTEVLNEDR